MDYDEDLDARGLLCPLPVLKTAKRLRAMERGQRLRVTTDDPAAAIDMPHFCVESGNVLVDTGEEAGAIMWVIERR